MSNEKEQLKKITQETYSSLLQSYPFLERVKILIKEEAAGAFKTIISLKKDRKHLVVKKIDSTPWKSSHKALRVMLNRIKKDKKRAYKEVFHRHYLMQGLTKYV